MLLRRSNRQAIALLCVIALHVVALWLLRGAMGVRAPRSAPAQQRVTLRLIPPPVPRVPATPAEAAPRPPATTAAGPRQTAAAPTVRTAITRMRTQDEVAVPASASAPPAAAAPELARSAEPAAGASNNLPSLLDTEATRRAIRASAHAPSLSDQLARSREEPRRAGAQERLGEAVKAAGKGDCAKGEYAGTGMGILSLPFLIAAGVRGDCAK